MAGESAEILLEQKRQAHRLEESKSNPLEPSKVPEDIEHLPRNKVVEESPQKRFSRFNELLWEDGYKSVYRGWDSSCGVEVAWNQVSSSALREGGSRILQELRLLQSLDHPNILKFFGSWLNKDQQTLVFITELLSSGSLKEFVRVHPLSLCTLKKWCREILKVLQYLHEHRIIHRGLTLENIFISGSTGEIRVGDLGLASSLGDGQRRGDKPGITPIKSLAEPCYVAPELYQGKYDEQVDVHAFGMCMLELVSGEPPYSECATAAETMKKIISHTEPLALSRLNNVPVLQLFIKKCITGSSATFSRPSADELLSDPFLQDSPDDQVMCSSLLCEQVVEQKSSGSPTPVVPKSSTKPTATTPMPMQPPTPVQMSSGSKTQGKPTPVAPKNSAIAAAAATTTTPSPAKRPPTPEQQVPSSGPAQLAQGNPTSVEQGNTAVARTPVRTVVSNQSSQQQQHGAAAQGKSGQVSWICSAKRSLASSDKLDVEVKLNDDSSNKITRIAFEFDLYKDSPTEMVLEMIKEGVFQSSVTKEEMASMSVQLERLQQKFTRVDLHRSTSNASIASSASSSSTPST